MDNVRDIRSTPAGLEHLFEVQDLVVEFVDSDLFGPLLHKLADADRPFTFREIYIGGKPVVAHDDLMTSRSNVVFLIEGPGYASEQVGPNAWMLDMDVRYEVISTAESPDCLTYRIESSAVKEQIEEGFQLTTEHVPALVRMAGGFLTELAVAISKKGHLDPEDLMSCMFEAVGANEIEVELITGEIEVASSYMKAATDKMIAAAQRTIEEQA